MAITFNEIKIRRSALVSSGGNLVRGWSVTAFDKAIAQESYACRSLSGVIMVVTCLFSGLPVPKCYYKAED